MQLRIVLGLSVAILSMVGCAPKAYVRPAFLDSPPRRVAVLPFVITYAYDLAQDQPLPPSHTIGRDLFRKTFYYALTPYGYEDMKLTEVDEKLAATWGPIEEGKWQQASTKQLGEALGADALIYGDISRIMHFTTPLYTETSLEASLRMVGTSSGEVLWRKDVKAADRGGALMKKGQVVDFLKDQARSFNPGVKFLRVSEAASRQLLKDFPNPPLSVETQMSFTGDRTTAGETAVRLAVLPLGVEHKNQHKAAEALRRWLVANLQESQFQVIEINRVDATLKSLGWNEGEPLPESLSLAQLADTMGADALLRGTVTSWGRTYLVVESWVKAGLQLELIDAQSGEAIWSQTKKNTRQAGILKGPTGYKAIAVAPITGLKTSNLERVADHLTREMAQDLATSPAVLAYVSERKP